MASFSFGEARFGCKLVKCLGGSKLRSRLFVWHARRFEYIEAGEGGPIDEGSKSKLARIQGEIDILTAIVEEVRRRQPDEEEGTT